MKYKGEADLFRGAATALITPFDQTGVDYEALGRVVDMQIQGGIDGLVVCGTTGESAVLSDDEKKRVIEFVLNRAGGKVPVIAGTGSNNTAHAAELTAFASEIGCDGILAVTPYYNKATQKGLAAHYFALADAGDKPVILYNVPSRTGLCIAPETYLALSEHPNIKAIKEAGGNISAIAKTMALVGDRLDLYSGNDDQTVPIMSLGGKGVISVASNIIPGQVSGMCHDFLEGRTEQALRAQLDLLELMNGLFTQVNPIPVKAAMSEMGWCRNILRLPLTPMEGAELQRLRELMKKHGLI